MTSGLCFACVPLVIGPFTEPPPHCQGMSDVAPLPGVLGGFRCSCACNPQKPVQFEEPKVRLRKRCVHGLYEEHVSYPCPHFRMQHSSVLEMRKCKVDYSTLCPGGEFLPEDALVAVWWCEEHGTNSWDERHTFCLLKPGLDDFEDTPCRMVKKYLVAADQVGEPG